MSVATAKVKLTTATRDLRIRWTEATQKWNDAASRSIEKNHLEPFEARVRSALNALDTMQDTLRIMQRDCGDD
jgi:hypothetical protein